MNKAKLEKRLKRLDTTYLLTLTLIKSHSRKYPGKMKYLKLLRDFCFKRGNELIRKTDWYAFIILNENLLKEV